MMSVQFLTKNLISIELIFAVRANCLHLYVQKKTAVMTTKLTLKLDRDVILKAKEYAASQHRSLSGIVEGYLQSLNSTHGTGENTDIEISDFVKSMSANAGMPGDLDYKVQYFEHLEEKYK